MKVLIVALRDENVAIGRHHNTCRLGQSVRWISGYPRLSKRQQDLAVRTKFYDDVALVLFSGKLCKLALIRGSLVSHPHVAIAVHIDLVGENEHTRAEIGRAHV